MPNVDVEVGDLCDCGFLPNQLDRLWSVRLRLRIAELEIDRGFDEVFFIESDQTAMLFGGDEQEGVPQALKVSLGLKQQEVIRFLRHATMSLAVRVQDKVLSDYFLVEAVATAAFVAWRGVGHGIRVGYRNPESHLYEVRRLDDSMGAFYREACRKLFESQRAGLAMVESVQTR